MNNLQEFTQKIFDVSEKPIQEWIADLTKKSATELFNTPVSYQERVQMVRASDPEQCFYAQLSVLDERKEDETVAILKSQAKEFDNVILMFNQSILVVTAATIKVGIPALNEEEFNRLKTITWEYDKNLFLWRSNLGGKVLAITLEKMTREQIEQITGMMEIDGAAFEEVD